MSEKLAFADNLSSSSNEKEFSAAEKIVQRKKEALGLNTRVGISTCWKAEYLDEDNEKLRLNLVHEEIKEKARFAKGEMTNTELNTSLITLFLNSVENTNSIPYIESHIANIYDRKEKGKYNIDGFCNFEDRNGEQWDFAFNFIDNTTSRGDLVTSVISNSKFNHHVDIWEKNGTYEKKDGVFCFAVGWGKNVTKALLNDDSFKVSSDVENGYMVKYEPAVKENPDSEDGNTEKKYNITDSIKFIFASELFEQSIVACKKFNNKDSENYKKSEAMFFFSRRLLVNIIGNQTDSRAEFTQKYKYIRENLAKSDPTYRNILNASLSMNPDKMLVKNSEDTIMYEEAKATRIEESFDDPNSNIYNFPRLREENPLDNPNNDDVFEFPEPKKDEEESVSVA